MSLKKNIYEKTITTSVSAPLNSENKSCKRRKIGSEKLHNYIIEQLPYANTLSLLNNNLDERDIYSLVELLKGSSITRLDLTNNKIRCKGLKCLAEALKDTQLATLNLGKNMIKDKGTFSLAAALKTNTRITYVDLSDNKIKCVAAQSLNESLNDKICSIHIDAYTSKAGNKYISQRSSHVKNMITLCGNGIGKDGAEYLNKILQNSVRSSELMLDDVALQVNDVAYLAKAFENVKISNLKMCYTHIMQSNGIEYLIQIFKGSHIVNLEVYGRELRTKGAQNLAQFLKQVNILNLNLRSNSICDEGMYHVAEALRSSDCMYVDLSWNKITCNGVCDLSQVLKYSKILHIDLSFNKMGVDGGKFLAAELPSSQVTDIKLVNESIDHEGYQYLLNVADSTNLTSGILHFNHIVTSNLRHAFKQLVSLNTITGELEFIVPGKNVIELDRYAFLIRTLTDDPNSKAHIFDMLCKQSVANDFDLTMMKKINEFIRIMPDKFIVFVESKLPDLVESFGIIDDNFVMLVKEFHQMALHAVVQNLLLHRVLYYMDENHEILHPFIYKMLRKHRMPLYNEQLEPTKKCDIISYYKTHQEIAGAKEVVDLLESKSV